MPRLFTGLEIPPDIAAEMAALRGGFLGARWTEPSDYHLTLRFLGDVDRRTADAFHDLLEGARPRSLAVTLEGLHAFGGERPRQLVVEARPDPSLSALAAEHERLARRAGLAPETRRFVPHVTLARLRNATPGDVAGYLSWRGGFPARRFAPRRVALFSAREGTGGGPYVVEATYPLG